MTGQGEFVTYGPAKTRIPQKLPPCWSCPKHAKDAPADTKKPLDEGEDFGIWFNDLLDWYAEGREVGFGPVEDLMRQVAGIIGRAEQQAESAANRHLMLTVLKRR